MITKHHFLGDFFEKRNYCCSSETEYLLFTVVQVRGRQEKDENFVPDRFNK